MRQRIVFRIAKRLEDYERDGMSEWADDLRQAVRRLLWLYPELERPIEMAQTQKTVTTCDGYGTQQGVRSFRVEINEMLDGNVVEGGVVAASDCDLSKRGLDRLKHFMARGLVSPSAAKAE